MASFKSVSQCRKKKCKRGVHP